MDERHRNLPGGAAQWLAPLRALGGAPSVGDCRDGRAGAADGAGGRAYHRLRRDAARAVSRRGVWHDSPAAVRAPAAAVGRDNAAARAARPRGGPAPDAASGDAQRDAGAVWRRRAWRDGASRAGGRALAAGALGRRYSARDSSGVLDAAGAVRAAGAALRFPFFSARQPPADVAQAALPRDAGTAADAADVSRQLRARGAGAGAAGLRRGAAAAAGLPLAC